MLPVGGWANLLIALGLAQGALQHTKLPHPIECHLVCYWCQQANDTIWTKKTMMDGFWRVKLAAEGHIFEGGSLSDWLFLHLPVLEVFQNAFLPSLVWLPVIPKFDYFFRTTNTYNTLWKSRHGISHSSVSQSPCILQFVNPAADFPHQLNRAECCYSQHNSILRTIWIWKLVALLTQLKVQRHIERERSNFHITHLFNVLFRHLHLGNLLDQRPFRHIPIGDVLTASVHSDAETLTS